MERRLYRSKDNQMIAGVCSGLGKYANLDVTIIRVLFALLALFGGAGIPLYIAMMITVPMEPSESHDSAAAVVEPTVTSDDDQPQS